MERRYQNLINRLTMTLPSERIITDPTLLFAYGTDASFYRMTPQVIVQVDTLDEAISTIKTCYQMAIPLTFRAAGTSLSGQAISDSVLMILTDSWREYEVKDEGAKIWLQPGIIGAEANRRLAPFGRKIGPDPASINTCKIGGIAANNASGMCCGTAKNSYRTLAGMSMILADGTYLDTLNPESIRQFRTTHSALLNALSSLAMSCKDNQALSDKIRHKYRLKNTTGYSLNALIDFSDPIDILQHLMIGSEGTLGFIADITYNTVVDHAHKASGLFVFRDIETTCLAVSELSKTSVAAVELMDSRSLASVADKPGMPPFIQTLSQQGDNEAAALLIELHGASEQQLYSQIIEITEKITKFAPTHEVGFSVDKPTCEQLWSIRKGLFPAVGAVRETGTTVIIEDVAFPIEQLASAVRDLQQLFVDFDYHEALIFGHALAGNLHFVFTQAFDTQREVKRYSDFMDAVSQLVAIDYKGSLKAEHGTGRNMAPFVEMEWGREGYQLMQAIKRMVDTRGILNPGVIINDSRSAHIENLKEMPAADPIIDACIECGFCEPVCPSRKLSLTPRQRNTVYREIRRLERTQEDRSRLAEMRKAFQYFGVDTCAATGLCAERCPVDIDTGDMVRRLRQEHTQFGETIARWSGEHFGTLARTAAVGLGIADRTHSIVGTSSMKTMASGLRRASGKIIPQWTPHMPRAVSGPEPQKPSNSTKNKVVYYPSCAARNMGPEKHAADHRPLYEVTLSVLRKAGYEVIIPDNLREQCCGMPFKTKGFPVTADQKAAELEELLWQASERGQLPVLMDTSPCVSMSKDTMRSELSIFEPFEFVAKFVLSQLDVTRQSEPVMLHITCTSRKRGLAGLIQEITEACCEHVVIPEDVSCCGFSGDKGFTHPELNTAALSPLRAQVPENCREGYSNSRTCEIGLSENSGIEYRSILYLIDKVSRAKQPETEVSVF
ncbi:FAD-binding and (Fe-S)-binding domain-containing protein [Veronia pacifica]|uniref:D-lactate dehydrogenase (cytochrome) n=2 Tax=Veronia pacifica TaxID=1080227 RepID=A0A1C3ER65_9GAMM|nr:FAD-binding and (Fe-S)-binding domain-containing protein [Veronia pacifica]ODA35745.1 4Fe-4S ferredoxin [Veronia pacifica]